MRNTHFLATVVVDLLTHGLPFEDIKRRYHLPTQSTRERYARFILSHGRCLYGALDPQTNQRPLITTTIWNLPEPMLPGETVTQYEDRTGCPQDLVHLALHSTPPARNFHTTPSTTPETTPSRRPLHRRILTSA